MTPTAFFLEAGCLYYSFSVTRYSSRFPKSSRVCASSPGNAERKNDMTGSVSHCKYKSGSFHAGYSLGLGGLMRQSMTKTITKKIVERVRIVEEICDKLCPNTVRPNEGLISGGIVLPMV